MGKCTCDEKCKNFFNNCFIRNAHLNFQKIWKVKSILIDCEKFEEVE